MKSLVKRKGILIKVTAQDLADAKVAARYESQRLRERVAVATLFRDAALERIRALAILARKAAA